jgi:hypothetical protein
MLNLDHAHIAEKVKASMGTQPDEAEPTDDGDSLSAGEMLHSALASKDWGAVEEAIKRCYE